MPSLSRVRRQSVHLAGQMRLADVDRRPIWKHNGSYRHSRADAAFDLSVWLYREAHIGSPWGRKWLLRGGLFMVHVPGHWDVAAG